MKLRYKQDRLAIVYLAAAIICLAVAFASSLPWLGLPIYVYLLRQVGLVQHLHTHVRLFEGRIINRVLAVGVGFVTGLPPTLYWYHHVMVHHRLNSTEEDWTGPYSYRSSRYPDRPVNKLVYVLTFMPRAWRRAPLEVWRKQPRRRRGLLFEFVMMLAGISTILVLTDIRKFVAYAGGSWMISYVGLALANWKHHVGCSFRSPLDSAHDYQGFLGGPFAFNIGYHAAHHVAPSMHWTKITDLDKSLRLSSSAA